MDKKVYGIIAKSVSGAVGTLDEPKIYGSFRIIQLLELFTEYAMIKGDILEEEYHIINDLIELVKASFMINEEEYKAHLKLLSIAVLELA